MQLKVVLSAVALCLALVIGCSNVDPLIGQVGGANTAPYVPNGPIPGDGAVNSLLSTGLKWASGDKDGDSVQYYLYFGTSATNMPLVATPKNGLFDSLNDLDFATTYYWKIVANDSSATTEGPVWSFTTKNAPLAVAGWTLINSDELSDDNITALAFDLNDTLWIGTRYAGLVKHDRAAMWKVYPMLSGIFGIVVDSHNNKWFGTWGQGLWEFNNAADSIWFYYNSVFSQSFPDNMISSLSICPTNDTILVGGVNGQTVAVMPDSLKMLSKDSLRLCKLLSKYPTWAYLREGTGNLWLGTERGIKINTSVLNKNTFDTTAKGILVITDTTVSAVYSTASGLPSNNIYCMVENGTKKWIGTDKGLAVYDGATWTVYTILNSGLPSNKVQSLAINSSGIKKLWIGTDAGLVVFDNP